MTQLAQIAGISRPLVCSLINNRRVIGEYTARKLGVALQLHGEDLEELIHLAISNCTEKVLEASKAYPSRVLNLVAGKLGSLGIEPRSIQRCERHQNSGALLRLANGRTAAIRVEVTCR